MTDSPILPRPSQLWKQLSAERRLQAATAFWRDEHAPAEQAEAVMTIAQRIKFRPKSVLALSVDRKARQLANLNAVSELVAARLLVDYHLEAQRPMMGRFLDALGIKHDNGLIDDEALQPPDGERLKAAAQAIAAEHPAEDVGVYLATLIWQDPETWGGLTEAPELQAASPAS